MLPASLCGLGPIDPIAYAGVAIIMSLAALAAVSVLAWRAAHVDPVVTLRPG